MFIGLFVFSLDSGKKVDFGDIVVDIDQYVLDDFFQEEDIIFFVEVGLFFSGYIKFIVIL